MLKQKHKKNTFKRFPIAHKLALVFTLIIGAGMVILGIVIAEDQASLLEKQMMSSSEMAVQQLAQIAKEPVLADDRLTLQVIIDRLDKQPGVVAVAIYSEELLPIIQTGLLPTPDTVSSHSQTNRQFIYARTPLSGALPLAVVGSISPMTVDGLTLGYALIGFDRSVVNSAKTHTIKTVGLITLFFVLVGALASIMLGNRLARPIKQIIDISSAISKGDYAFRFTNQRNDELGELMRAMNAMTEGLAQKEHLEKTFSRYVAPKVAKEVLKKTQPTSDGKSIKASALFADIVGFTKLSENLPADQINKLINEYFSQIAQIVDACNGYIDKYIGDCVMAIFGVPQYDPLHAQNAVECAVLIQHYVNGLNHKRSQQGKQIIEFHIGVNSGTMLAGNIGAADRMDYTVMGKEVNTASRLSGAAKARQVLISESTYLAVKLLPHILCQTSETITLRGSSQPALTYTACLNHNFIQNFAKTKLDHLQIPDKQS